MRPAATSSPRRRTYTLATVAAELGGAVNRLDQANVPDFKRVWFMNPRSYNYLYNVQNSLGVYVYRDELNKGTLAELPGQEDDPDPDLVLGCDRRPTRICRSCSWSR
jgi:hypothetical protein